MSAVHISLEGADTRRTISRQYFLGRTTELVKILWPVDIPYLLNAEATEATVSSSNKTENADVVCSSWEQVKSEARDQQSEDTRRESVAKNDSHSRELSLEKGL